MAGKERSVSVCICTCHSINSSKAVLTHAKKKSTRNIHTIIVHGLRVRETQFIVLIPLPIEKYIFSCWISATTNPHLASSIAPRSNVYFDRSFDPDASEPAVYIYEATTTQNRQ
jgi:hypothetical protein